MRILPPNLCTLSIQYTVCIKKRLAFEIQISHNVLNLPDNLASRKTKDFLLMGHNRLISFVNNTRQSLDNLNAISCIRD